MPETQTRYGSVVLSPGFVISPGGHSFGSDRASRRQHRRISQGKNRRVVHRHAEVPRKISEGEEEPDPIRAHRAQPKYLEMASACNVPGAEIVRVVPDSTPGDAKIRRLTVDDTRNNYLGKLQTNIIRERAEQLANRDSLRRQRSREGGPDEADESTHLLGESMHEDDLSFDLPFTVSLLHAAATPCQLRDPAR